MIPNAKDHKISVIYLIRNNINGKIYVGSAKNFWRRFRNYRVYSGTNRKPTMVMERAVQKYGIESFEFEILEQVIDKSTLASREQYWIDRLQPFRPVGYNVNKKAFSRLGMKLSDESRKKISDNSTTSKRVCKIDRITNQVVEIFKSGSEAEKTIGVGKGFVSRVCLGSRPSAGGFFWCYEDNIDSFIPPINKSIKNKPLEQLDMHGNKITEWESLSQASKENGYERCNITRACSGKYGHAYGFKWRYKS